jgi:hypothetical protein
MHNIHDIKSIFGQNVFIYIINVKGGTQNTNLKVIIQHKMTCVMCNPWKRTFTLTPMVPLTMFSPTVR